MMMLKKLIISLFIPFLGVAQNLYTVKDALEKTSLPNVLIYYDNNSVYSGADGTFSLPENLQNEQIVVDGLGYELLKIDVATIDDRIIFLNKRNEFLDAVEISNKPKKSIKIEEKASKKRFWLDGAPHYHGREYGLFIPKGDNKLDIKLLNITIPLIKRNPDWEKARAYQNKNPKKKTAPIKNRKLENSFLFRIQLYKIEEDSTFTKLDYPTKEFIVKKDVYKYEIDYSDSDVFFPEKGILIGVLNMGPCDDKGNMLSIPRFKKTVINDRAFQIVNNVYDLPYMALHAKPKNESIAFVNFHRSPSSKWMIVPEGIFPRTIGGPKKQLGIGYELEKIIY